MSDIGSPSCGTPHPWYDTLLVDDDTLCRLARVPGAGDGLALSSADDPTEFHFFDSEAAALSAAPFAEAEEFLAANKAESKASEIGVNEAFGLGLGEPVAISAEATPTPSAVWRTSCTMPRSFLRIALSS